MEQLSNIYVFTNKHNNKKYVGQSINPEERYKQHFKDAKNKDYLFYRAINKYGKDGFDFEIIERNIPLDSIHDRERFWIKELNSKTPKGYNCTDGGEGTFGYSHTEESKLKMSMHSKHKGMWERTEEHRKLLSEMNKGKVISESTKQKLSKANKGSVVSQERRDKLSKSLKGRIITDKHRENMKKSWENRSTEEKDELFRKSVTTKKNNGMDFAKHFREMNDEEKTIMYEKISINNKRSKPIRCLDSDGTIVNEFHSIGSAGKWIYETQNTSKNAKVHIRKSIERNNTAYGYKWEYIAS